MVFTYMTKDGIISNFCGIKSDFYLNDPFEDSDLFSSDPILEEWLNGSQKQNITTIRKKLENILPLYNLEKSFWENLENGPRQLTEKEEEILKRLELLVDPQKTNFLGKKINSKIGLAAGPAPNSEWLKFYSELGFDFLISKTVRLYQHDGHDIPNIMYVDKNSNGEFEETSNFRGTITNYFGIPSNEPEIWINDFKKFTKQLPKDKVFVMSGVSTPIENTREEIINQFRELVKISKEDVKADGFEADLSCPNLKSNEGSLYEDTNLLKDIILGMREEIEDEYPISIKIGLSNNYEKIIEEVGQYINILNLLNAPPSNVKVDNRTIKCGICGRELYKISFPILEKINELRNNGDYNFEIIGAGGIGPSTIEYLLKEDLDIFYSMATEAMFSPFSAKLCKMIINKYN